MHVYAHIIHQKPHNRIFVAKIETARIVRSSSISLHRIYLHLQHGNNVLILWLCPVWTHVPKSVRTGICNTLPSRGIGECEFNIASAFRFRTVMRFVVFGDTLGANMRRGRAPTDNSDVLAMFRLQCSGEGASRPLVDDAS